MFDSGAFPSAVSSTRQTVVSVDSLLILRDASSVTLNTETKVSTELIKSTE